jgi:acyl-CoA synthetase (AMP-forming)/AMP-acid ligase II
MTFPGLASWIQRRAERTPDRIALGTPVGAISYDEFARRARSFGRRLLELEVRPGDRIAYHGPNHPAALYSLFGARAVGAVWVPLLPGRTAEEEAHVLRDSGARLLVTADPEIGPAADIASVSPEGLEASDPETALPVVPTEPGELALLGYTSGTTGPPKGVMLTEANILWNAVQMVPVLPVSAADVTLGAAPFTRIGGLGVTVLPTLFVGGTVVIPADTYGPTVLDMIEREGVTVVFANSDLLDRMACAPGWPEADLSRIRAAVVGGGLVPLSLLRTYLDRGVPLRHGYGLTEAAPAVSVLETGEVTERPVSVGKPLPFVDVRAVRPDDGSVCAPNEVGAWQIRGPNVFAGYWGLPSPFDPDGWFDTGDIGSIDDEGYLTFVDRASSIIATGGSFVYPSRIESELFDVRGVSDVAVVEVDGAVVAAVVPDEGDETVVDVARRRLRASIADAQPTDVRAVTEIPRNAAGKVRRDALRELLRGASA